MIVLARRAALDEWLRGARIGDEDASRLRHAIGELTTNAMEHAYPDSASDGHTVTLSDTGEVQAQVLDQGHWREPQTCPHRGLGLQLAAGLVDTLCIERPRRHHHHRPASSNPTGPAADRRRADVRNGCGATRPTQPLSGTGAAVRAATAAARRRTHRRHHRRLPSTPQYTPPAPPAPTP
jgi:histidine kinase-like protein